MIHVRLLQRSNYSTNDHKGAYPKILLRLLQWIQITNRRVLKAILVWAFQGTLTKIDVEAFADMLTQPGGPAKKAKEAMTVQTFRGQTVSIQSPDISGTADLEAIGQKNLVVRGEDWATACKLYRATTLAYMEMIDQEDIPQCLRDLFDIIAQYDALNGNHMGAWENSRKRLETLEDELGH